MGGHDDTASGDQLTALSERPAHVTGYHHLGLEAVTLAPSRRNEAIGCVRPFPLRPALPSPAGAHASMAAGLGVRGQAKPPKGLAC